MSLARQAERDLAATLESDTDFGWPIQVTDPANVTHERQGQPTQVSLSVDPDTGAVVSGERAVVTFRIRSLLAVFDSLPVAVPSGRPWVLAWTDTNSVAHRFKVVASMPDRTLGLITLDLGKHRGP